jgi:hypothetical protein
MQLTLTQVEANDLLFALELATEALSDDADAKHRVTDWSILWDKIFDTGLEADFANQFMEFQEGERPEHMARINKE